MVIWVVGKGILKMMEVLNNYWLRFLPNYINNTQSPFSALSLWALIAGRLLVKHLFE